MKFSGFLNRVWIVCLLLSATTAAGRPWKGEVNEDIPRLKKLADDGDARAMADYAFHSMRCMGDTPYNQDLIFKFFSRSAELDDEEGRVGLAHCYIFGVGTEADFAKAHGLLAGAFERRHPVSLKLMGYLYGGYGGVLEPDSDKGLELTKEAAEGGCVAAQFNVAITEMKGRWGGVERDQGMKQMRDLHERRVFPMATAHLLYYLRYFGFWDDDDELYAECYRLTHHYAKLGEPDALFRLGGCYHGTGDYEQAIAYYAQAIAAGSRLAWVRMWSTMSPRNQSIQIRMTADQRMTFALRGYLQGNIFATLIETSVDRFLATKDSPESQKMLPRYERDLRFVLMHHHARTAHHELASIYLAADPKLNPELAREDLAIAHMTAACHTSRAAREGLGMIFYERKERSDEDLARALVCADLARKRGSKYWGEKSDRSKDLQSLVTPAIRKRANALRKDGYPDWKRHRHPAEDLLIKEGHLPSRENTSYYEP